MGMFLNGAYQEILGDLHNLFGDTNAVHVELSDDGYQISHVVKGDSVTEVLRTSSTSPRTWSRPCAARPNAPFAGPHHERTDAQAAPALRRIAAQLHVPHRQTDASRAPTWCPHDPLHGDFCVEATSVTPPFHASTLTRPNGSVSTTNAERLRLRDLTSPDQRRTAPFTKPNGSLSATYLAENTAVLHTAWNGSVSMGRLSNQQNPKS